MARTLQFVPTQDLLDEIATRNKEVQRIDSRIDKLGGAYHMYTCTGDCDDVAISSLVSSCTDDLTVLVSGEIGLSSTPQFIDHEKNPTFFRFDVNKNVSVQLDFTDSEFSDASKAACHSDISLMIKLGDGNLSVSGITYHSTGKGGLYAIKSAGSDGIMRIEDCSISGLFSVGIQNVGTDTMYIDNAHIDITGECAVTGQDELGSDGGPLYISNSYITGTCNFLVYASIPINVWVFITNSYISNSLNRECTIVSISAWAAISNTFMQSISSHECIAAHGWRYVAIRDCSISVSAISALYLDDVVISFCGCYFTGFKTLVSNPSSPYIVLTNCAFDIDRLVYGSNMTVTMEGCYCRGSEGFNVFDLGGDCHVTLTDMCFVSNSGNNKNISLTSDTSRLTLSNCYINSIGYVIYVSKGTAVVMNSYIMSSGGPTCIYASSSNSVMHIMSTYIKNDGGDTIYVAFSARLFLSMSMLSHIGSAYAMTISSGIVNMIGIYVTSSTAGLTVSGGGSMLISAAYISANGTGINTSSLSGQAYVVSNTYIVLAKGGSATKGMYIVVNSAFIIESSYIYIDAASGSSYAIHAGGTASYNGRVMVINCSLYSVTGSGAAYGLYIDSSVNYKRVVVCIGCTITGSGSVKSIGVNVTSRYIAIVLMNNIFPKTSSGVQMSPIVMGNSSATANIFYYIVGNTFTTSTISIALSEVAYTTISAGKYFPQYGNQFSANIVIPRPVVR